MQHDIYSLGVCLLELGLWESFVTYEDTDEALSNGRPSSMLGVDTTTHLLKERLVALAQGELRSMMGTIYSEVVVTSLDPENTDFGDESEFKDEDGIEVEVQSVYGEGVDEGQQYQCLDFA